MRLTYHLLPLVLLVCSPAAAAFEGRKTGEVSFIKSGARAAQRTFLEALAHLHNFEYGRAAVAFRAAQQIDPDFVMAYWGEAMTYNHPVWLVQDAGRARAVLARLGANRAERLAKASTERERGYLDAVEALYGSGTKAERDSAYSAQMERLYIAYPEDVDARAFYALSLLGLAHEGRDHRLYMRAAGLLEEVFPMHQRHPGVLHYLIHSYDDPVHAPLGLRAARLYGAIAPDAGHALHMTTHVFIALGMWDDVVRENDRAMAVVNRLRAAANQPPSRCHHYSEWQIYGEYQRGQRDEAERLLALCREEARMEVRDPRFALPIEPDRSTVALYSSLAVRRLVETGFWEGSEQFALPEGRFLASRVTLAYGDLIDAHRGGESVRPAHRNLIEAHQRWLQIVGEPLPAAKRRGELYLRQAAALSQIEGGDLAAGLQTLREAAEQERDMPAEFGPPLVEKPSFELLADLLVRSGRQEEALQFYREALLLSPGRRLAQVGAVGR